jgi:hypothetical protein
MMCPLSTGSPPRCRSPISWYRLLDSGAMKAAEERGRRDQFIGNGDCGPDPSYKGKALQLEFFVEDDGVLATPWSATINVSAPLWGMAGRGLRRKYTRIRCWKRNRGPARGQAGFLNAKNEHPVALSPTLPLYIWRCRVTTQPRPSLPSGHEKQASGIPLANIVRVLRLGAGTS